MIMSEVLLVLGALISPPPHIKLDPFYLSCVVILLFFQLITEYLALSMFSLFADATKRPDKSIEKLESKITKIRHRLSLPAKEFSEDTTQQTPDDIAEADRGARAPLNAEMTPGSTKRRH
jgi:hypothetical protein